MTFTHLALGSGTGSGDQSARVALETQHDIEAVTGVAAPAAARIPIRADYMPAQAYAVTEVGLFAQIGAGAEFLCAYWIAESAADAVAAAAVNTTLVIAGIIEVQSAAADIAVAPAVNISIGAPTNVVYQTQHATVDQRGILELATLLEGRAGTDNDRAITALVLAGVLTSYATTAALDQRFTDLIGAAPVTLDTIHEIAAWLGNDANLATAIMNAVAGRVRRAGDTMTGALDLVSPDDDDDSQNAAPTSWVLARLREMGVIQQKYLYYNGTATGLVLDVDDAGTLINLEHDITDIPVYRGACVAETGVDPNDDEPLRSMPTAVADIPVARDRRRGPLLFNGAAEGRRIL